MSLRDQYPEEFAKAMAEADDDIMELDELPSNYLHQALEDALRANLYETRPWIAINREWQANDKYTIVRYGSVQNCTVDDLREGQMVWVRDCDSGVSGRAKIETITVPRYGYIVLRVDWDSLRKEHPSLADAAGMFPDFTGGLSAVDYIKEMRNL